jgi:hypothetical protein
MWESRALCEISKALWKPFLGFHRDVISTAAPIVHVIGRLGGYWTLAAMPIVVPGASYAVVCDHLVLRRLIRQTFSPAAALSVVRVP